MKTIKVSKAELLSHLRTNRENHIVEYNDALVQYRLALQEAFKDALKQAKNNEDVEHRVNVVRPQNYTKAYDEAITMLEWDVEDSVELDQHEFKQYVQDEWGWKNEFLATTRIYGKH